jgi:hypothetical protein
MKNSKQIGIWMDYSKAHIVTPKPDSIDTIIIESKPESIVSEQDVYLKDESHQLNREKAHLTVYFKKISDIILKYDEVLLFGPTDAKKELYNQLKDDNHFSHIQFVVKSVDKMTDNQIYAYFKEYFHPEK